MKKAKIEDISISFTPHEIRTPMTAVIGYLWLLKHKGGKLTPKQRVYLEKALENGQKLTGLVNKKIKEKR